MKLSVCIPTHNRAAYLPSTLASVAAQWRDDMEIVVSDNASGDNTQEIVEEYRARLGAVRFHRWNENVGADRNFSMAVELATGAYRWILGSDDQLVPGAISAIGGAIDQGHPDLILFNRVLCTSAMVPVQEDRFLVPGGLSYDFAKSGELGRYLGNARSVCAAFTYLSSTVFTNVAWGSVANIESWNGTAYAHARRLLGACMHGARLKHIDAPLVMCRLGNDSFRSGGLASRVMLDLDGFRRLADELFGDRGTLASRELLHLLRYEYPLGRVLRYQGLLGDDPAWPQILDRLAADTGHSPVMLRVVSLLGRIPPVVRLSFMIRDLRSHIARKIASVRMPSS